MNQNISAHLDLTKSLRGFEETVTQLLSFTNIEEWDGRTIKNKEEKSGFGIIFRIFSSVLIFQILIDYLIFITSLNIYRMEVDAAFSQGKLI